MIKIPVYLRDMCDAKHLVQAASGCEKNVDLICGRYIVDADVYKRQEVERYLNARMNFGISDISEDEYQANAQYRKAQKACRQCIYLGMNIILKYEDLQYEEQKEFVITQGERMHFMMTLFQESFEKAEEELRQLFAQAPENGAAVKFAAMDLLFGCMKFP